MKENLSETDLFLQEETNKLNRSSKRTYLVSVILAVILTGYLGFIYTSFSRMMDPEELSPILINQGQAILEDVIDTYEGELKDQAPVLADEFSRRINDDVIPSVGLLARTQIDLIHESMIPFISTEFVSFFEAYFAQHSEELQMLASLAEEEGAHVFVDGMWAEFTTNVDQVFRASHPEQAGIPEFQEKIDVTLLAMEDTLENLLSQEIEELTRRERLQRQLLAHLVQLILERI